VKGLIFVYLACYGGAVASLFNPFVGLLVGISFSILRPDSLWFWAVPQGNYSMTVSLGMLAGWAFQGFGDWKLGRAWGVMLMLGFFSLWSVILVAIAAVDSTVAWVMAEMVLKLVLPVLVGISLLDSVAKLRMVAWIILLSEGYLAFDFNMSYFSGYNRLRLEGFAALDNNGMGVGLVSCLGLAFFLGLNEGRWWLKAVAFGAGVLILHAVLLSYSRGAMLSMGITGLVCFILIPKRPLHVTVFAVAVLLLARLAGPQVIERFESSFAEKGEDGSIDTRREQWAACAQCMKDHPLGIGPDQWRLINGSYGVLPGQAAHSTWMQVGVEFGLPGLASLLLYYLLCMARILTMTRTSTPVPDPWFRPLAQMVVASLTGFMVAAQFVTLYMMEIPYYIALIGAGLLKLSSREDFNGQWTQISDNSMLETLPKPVVS
jgi:O-antigen ligase